MSTYVCLTQIIPSFFQIIPSFSIIPSFLCLFDPNHPSLLSLILAQGGCWVIAPSVLLTESGTPMPKYNALDTLAFESLDGAESTPDIVDSIEGIKAGLSSASKGSEHHSPPSPPLTPLPLN